MVPVMTPLGIDPHLPRGCLASLVLSAPQNTPAMPVGSLKTHYARCCGFLSNRALSPSTRSHFSYFFKARAKGPLHQSAIYRAHPDCHRSARVAVLSWFATISRNKSRTVISANVSRSKEFYNRAISDLSLVSCHNCDLLQRLPPITPGGSARCPRCNEEICRRREDSLPRTLALAIAAALLYVVANSVPMLGLTVVGREASTTVFGGAMHLWSDRRDTVAALVLFTAIIAPALQIGFMLAIVLGALRESPPRWVAVLLRHHPLTRIWSMIEVMMLGVLVALTKIAELAT